MLTISPTYRSILAQELRFAASQMREAQHPADKVYFLSATWAQIQRVFNLEFDSELVLAHQVLSLAHNHIQGKVSGQHPGPMAAYFPPSIFEFLAADLEELASRWEAGQEAADVLEHVALLGYACTGNGVYLFKKGLLKL